jgi:hypothetical protein
MAAKVYFSVVAYEGPEGDRLQLARFPEVKRAWPEAKASEVIAVFGEVSMVANQERFVAAWQSRTYSNLVIEFEVLPEEFHTTTVPLQFSRSMRYLFDAPRSSLQGWKGYLNQIISMYGDDFPREMFIVEYSRQDAVGRFTREPKRGVERAQRSHGLKVEKI